MVGLPEGHRRLVEEVANVYTWIESQQRREPHRAGSCNACGACCDFIAYEHRLYVTPPELIYLAVKLNVDRLGKRQIGPALRGKNILARFFPLKRAIARRELRPFHSSTKSNPEIPLKNTGPICLFPSHRLLPMPTGRCPYQQDNRCTIHEHRFAGCRIFTCRGDSAFQSDLSEAALKRLKQLCEELRVPYRYQDLPTALNTFAIQSYGVGPDPGATPNSSTA
ncbi:MAG: YkgJ family cysteine cluster protein [Phycisphaerae bacterium]|nr:YkgJ family cysteine cluster protein [Phycisphaerae bacterium]